MESYFLNLNMQRKLYELKELFPDNDGILKRISSLDSLLKEQQKELISDENIIVWSYDLKNKLDYVHFGGRIAEVFKLINCDEQYIEYIHRDDRQKFKKFLRKVRAGNFAEVYYRWNYEYDRNNNEELRYSVVRYIDDELSYVIDSEVKNSEKSSIEKFKDNSIIKVSSLNEENFDLATIFEAVPIPISYKDESRRCLGCNDEMKNVYDLFDIKNYLGSTVEDYSVIHDADVLKEFAAEEEKLLKSGGSVMVSISLLDKYGAKRNFSIASTLIKSKNSKMFISTAIDHTKLIASRNNFASLNNQFYKIMNIMGEALIYFDKNLDVILANRVAQKFYKSSLEGKNFAAFIGTKSLLKTIKKELCEQNVSRTLLLSEKRGRKYFDMTFYSLFENRKFDGLVMVIKDITNRVLADKKNYTQQQQLLQADKLSTLGTLVSGVAHEINNPANFISINSSILKKIVFDLEPILNFYYQHNGEFSVANFHCSSIMNTLDIVVNGLQEGVERIDNIVKTLKEYSRDHSVDRHHLVNINNAINKALTIMHSEIHQSTNNFIVDLYEPMPKINADILKIEQVIINLVQNACQALKNFNSLLRITSYHDKVINSVVVVVQDEGLGIKKKYLQKIKDPFFTTKRDAGGTGLGLSICAAIVQEHKGVIEIKSEDGVGTIVRLIFPVTESIE
ncbi:ATP-binding protein [Lentisphaerota bacterium WC36G]|nr:GHKL domain-containing protein [Lentisphaerae bacterium WC36]